MKFNGLTPILWTTDLQRTIAFYEAVLGFKGKSNFPNFVSLTRGSVEVMFVVPTVEDGCEVKPELTGSIFIFMEGVETFWNEVRDKVTIKSPIADREYFMRDFSIVDNNGYELVFGEDISQRKQTSKA